MVERTVHCSRRLAHAPGRVWRTIADFDLDWHPAVRSCRLVRHASGGLLREFEDQDGNGFTEQRTYLSDSDRVLGYRVMSGIEGVFSYKARVRVEPVQDGGSRVVWTAEILAREDRADAIAAGTERIFSTGLDALAKMQGRGKAATKRPDLKEGVVSETAVSGSPRLTCLAGSWKMKAERPLVLFLHGIGGQASNWRAQLTWLSGSYDVAALNMRGYGGSELGSKPTTIDDYCDDILRVAASFGAQRLVLVGLSFGAWIATSFAMRHGDKLAGLVLAGGCTGMSEAGATERLTFLAAREKPLADGRTPADFAPGVVDAIAGPDASEAVRDTLFQSMAAIPADTYRDALRCFCNPSETFDFSKIECPVLMMTGEHDTLAKPAQIRAVSERIRDAATDSGLPIDVQFEMISGAGHVCNLEAREPFNAHLARYLGRLPGVARDYRPAPQERQRQKRDRILQAAHQEFCAKGFDGSSMEAIARAADVSKPTLYQYFTDKNGLLSAILDVGRAHITAPLAPSRGALVDRLWSFSWTYADYVLRPDMLSLARLILGEAARKPKSAIAYHQAGPGMAFAGLVEFIKGCEAAGDLLTDDPEFAAQDLWSLILSGPRDHYLHYAQERPTRPELLRSIAHGLRVFLRVYSTNVKADLKALDALVTAERNELELTGG